MEPGGGRGSKGACHVLVQRTRSRTCAVDGALSEGIAVIAPGMRVWSGCAEEDSKTDLEFVVDFGALTCHFPVSLKSSELV